MKNKTLQYLSTAILLATSLSCTTKTDSADGHHNHQHKGHNHEGEIVISKEDASSFGIKTAKLEYQPFNNVIRVTGKITGNSSDEVTISAPIAGILTLSNSVSVGAEVNSGKYLGSVAVNSVSGGNPNESAKIAVDAAKKELDRLDPLLKEGIVTQKEYNAALANYQSAKSLYSPQASGTISAPILGVISDIFAKSGEYVSVGSPIVKINKNSSLMLLADLPEKYHNILQNISTANIRLPYSDEWVSIDSLGGKKITTGNVENISRTGYIPVLFSLSNNGKLSSGSYVDVCIISDTNNNSLSVPNEAIIEQQGNYFVFVKTGGHSYKKHRVMIGESNGFKTQILSGVKAGDNVVIKGATMVLLSEQSGNIPHGHSHNH